MRGTGEFPKQGFFAPFSKIRSAKRISTAARIAAALCLAAAASGCTLGTNMSQVRASIEDFEYQGAFRVSLDDLDVNYANGTLGYNPARNSLYMAGHSWYHSFAEFAIPELGRGDAVSSLPAVTSSLRRSGDIFQGSIENPDGLNRINGFLYLDGSLIINVENWYDAGGTARDTSLVMPDADNLDGARLGYYRLSGAAHSGGYMGAIPQEWQGKLGGQFYTGWASNCSIISRYSVGPSLFAFNPRDMLGGSPPGPVATSAIMDFPHQDGHYLGSDALQVERGVAPALWNFLSKAMYGFIIPGTKTFAAIGSSGGIDSGIGYKITQDDGTLSGGYSSYAARDNYNYYWLFDLDEMLEAENAYDPRPYAYGRWSIPFDGGNEHPILGGTFDPSRGILYVSLAGAGSVGEYDYVPLIVAYKIKQR